MTDQPVHASCVAIAGQGVLIVGPSGSGKSDLALRLIDRGARLVADDYCYLEPSPRKIVAAAPSAIAGLIEVRGIGICASPHLDACAVRLVVRLCNDPERMPPEEATMSIAGHALPVIEVNPHAASTPIVVEWALRRILNEDAGE